MIFIESRNGFAFDDPILKLFNPIELTWLTFSLIYGSIIFAVLHLINKPNQFILAIQSYIVMVILRVVAMYLLPLEPPKDMIILIDPFVEFFGTGRTLTKDLFFSGHTATIFLIFLVIENTTIKKIFLTASILIGISVLVQHVHYSIDVFTAPFFAYVSFKLVNCIKIQINRN
ncbi:MAG: sphingomyelin synthase family protein [Ignavibacteria bacterium]|nr:sphingomyelin synthase family protein [Ignavibacteria bacterium]